MARRLARCSSARDRFEELQGGDEAVARGGFLGEVGLGDRLVEFDDRLPFFDRFALLDEQIVNMSFDGGGQGRELIGKRLATAEAFNRDGQRAFDGRFDLDDDDRLFIFLFLVRFLAVGFALAAPGQKRGAEDRCKFSEALSSRHPLGFPDPFILENRPSR